LRKVAFSRKQQGIADVFLSLRKFLQAKKIVSSVFVLHAAFVALTAIPPAHDRTDQPGLDLSDLGELRMSGVCAGIFRQTLEVGMGNEDAERIENDGCSMLPGTLCMHQLAE